MDLLEAINASVSIEVAETAPLILCLSKHNFSFATRCAAAHHDRTARTGCLELPTMSRCNPWSGARKINTGATKLATSTALAESCLDPTTKGLLN